MNSNVQPILGKLYNECAKLKLKDAKLSDSYYYNSLPLCLIDSIFSIGVRYSGVINTISRFCNKKKVSRVSYQRNSSALQSMYDCYTVSQFIEDISSYTLSDFGADELYGNHQRTSARNGILKAEAVYRAAKVLREHSIDSFADIRSVSDIELDSIENEFCEIPGQKSHISWEYFLMLSGDDNHIKVDRWIERFYEDVTGTKNTKSIIEGDLITVCNMLKQSYPGITPRLLDHVIWKTMSQKG